MVSSAVRNLIRKWLRHVLLERRIADLESAHRQQVAWNILEIARLHARIDQLLDTLHKQYGLQVKP